MPLFHNPVTYWQPSTFYDGDDQCPEFLYHFAYHRMHIETGNVQEDTVCVCNEKDLAVLLNYWNKGPFWKYWA